MSDDQIQSRDGGDGSEGAYEEQEWEEEEEEQEEESPEEVEAREDAESRQVYQTPQGYYPPQGQQTAEAPVDEEGEYLRAAFGDEAFERLERRVWQRILQHGQFADTNSILQQREAATAPEGYRQYGTAHAQFLSQMAPQQRATEQGVRSARLAVLFDEAERAGGTPEAYASAFRRHAALLEGKREKTGTPRPLPPTERVPAQGSTGTGRSAPAPQAGTRTREKERKGSVVERLSERFGKSGLTNLIEEGKDDRWGWGTRRPRWRGCVEGARCCE